MEETRGATAVSGPIHAGSPDAEIWALEVDRTFKTFQSLIAIGQCLLQKERPLQAAVTAQIAAHYASYNHPGQFYSLRLEQLIRAISDYESPHSRLSAGYTFKHRDIKRVLHVLTAAKPVGGDSRYVWRWIRRDPHRQHFVALTQQMAHEVPRPLLDAVAMANGSVHVLDSERENVLKRAQKLRRIAESFDVVVLHVYPEDVVPLIAFANKSGIPPILFVAQADHQFCIGVSASDLMVPLREAGARIAVARRGMPADRMALLPIPIDLNAPTLSKFEARLRLGLSEHQIVLLSIARSVKYTPIEGPSFPEVLVPVIEKYQDAILFVVGPDNINQWKSAGERTQGRIRALGQRSDTELLYQAADIYLDSFPFASNTSLLEAGTHGLPLVSYCPFSREAYVLAAGAPGIEQTLVRTTAIGEFQEAVTLLIDDPTYRVQLGAKTREEIVDAHCGDSWNRCLRELYQKTAALSSHCDPWIDGSVSRVGELDVLLRRFYSGSEPLGWVIGWYARHLGYLARIQLLLALSEVDRSFSFSMFLPMPVGRWLGARMKGWRKWPILGWALSAKG